jgi:hypothetical protein
LPYQRSPVSPASSVSTHTAHGSSSSSRQHRTSPRPRTQSPVLAAGYTGSHGGRRHGGGPGSGHGGGHGAGGRSPSREPRGSPSHRSPSRSPRSSLVPSPLGPPGPVALSEHRRRSKEAQELARRDSAGDLTSGRSLMTPPEAMALQMVTLQPPVNRPRSNSGPLTHVRRSSSDGDTYLNLIPSFRFVQGNLLESHSSDSSVLLNRDASHMLNPHLSAFRKQSFQDSDLVLASNYPVYSEDIRPRTIGGRQWGPPQQVIKSESSEHSSTATGRTDSSGGMGPESKVDTLRYSSPVFHFHTPPSTDDTTSSSSKDSYHR